jgi:hypothetical protein
MKLTAEFVRCRLNYDPETGLFTWKAREERRPIDRSWNSRRAGTLAGSENSEGYVEIYLDTRSYKAHHLAWLFVHGTTVSMLDHIDRNRANNRIANLRPASVRENNWNRSRSTKNLTGTKGVSREGSSDKWVARITANKRQYRLGTFEKKADAIAARRAAERSFYGDFSPKEM